MLVRIALFLLACSHALGTTATSSSRLLARADEEFAADGAAVRHLRGGSPDIVDLAPQDGGRRNRHNQSIAERAVFPVVLATFILAFGFFWDDGENDLNSKVAQRMELWAPPVLCAAGGDTAKKKCGKDAEGPEACVLPVLSSDFVRTCSTTQLAVARVSFGELDGWSTDVLGFMGVPVLSASAHRDVDGIRVLEIRRRGGNKDDAPLVAVRAGQVSNAGRSIGRFTTSGTGQQVFEGPHGLPLLTADQPGADNVLTLSSTSESRQVQATASWRAASAVLPAEHLEVSAQPGVDAALALACVLATLDANGHKQGSRG